MPRKVYKYSIDKERFDRIPGSERKYLDKRTGETVGRQYVYNRSLRVPLSSKEMRLRKERKQGRHQNRVMWFKNHHNREVWLRGGSLYEYMSYSDAEYDKEFMDMELLIRSQDAYIRDLAYDFFDDLEFEYEEIEWGETP